MANPLQLVTGALATVDDPMLQRPLVDLGYLDPPDLRAGVLSLRVRLGYPAASLAAEVIDSLTQAVRGLPGVDRVEVDFGWRIMPHGGPHNGQPLRGVKNLIAIASGKGGVGKSTTAVNLALALQAEGARVGVLDADVYGPSQALMLGIAEGTRPEVAEQRFFLPVPALGLQVMSMALLVTDKTPMVWRGPMASGALQQLLNQTLWDGLDYLVVDMPPGTGDIQLTLAQQAPVTGAVIVTTPQDIATQDARKGIEMFRKVDIPILGVVENMAVHRCSNCGHEEHLFGAGGGERVAQEYATALLGALPLDARIREQTDAGRPTLVVDPEGDLAQAYRRAAVGAAARIEALRERSTAQFPTITVSDD